MSLAEKPGYKSTPCGWIPAAWSAEKLSGLVDVIYGKSPADIKRSERGIPIYGTGGISGYTDSPLYEGPSIILGRKGTIDKVQRSDGPFWAIDTTFYTTPKVTFDWSWLYYCISSFDLRKLNEASGVPSLSRDSLESLDIALPPLPEQQKIAAILTAVDDKLDVIARQIDATQTLKQGLMQTLFSKGVGTQDATGRWIPHTEFKDSELGKIPALWDVGAIADYVSALRSGVSVNAEDRVHGDDEVGVLKVSCVSRGGFYPNCHKTVVPEERERVAEPVLQGRIIVSRANTPALVGESAYVDSAWPNLYLPDKLWQIEPSERPHSIKWLSFYLQSPFARQEISKAATGTSGSMKNIAKPAFLSIRMPLVPLAEQEHIAAILSGVTSKIEALSSKQGHYQTFKRGLMQKLLTGEWPVKLDSPSGTV
ncbi:restriction endonuclease subunit S [Pseudomonas sp. GD03855]|nr:restriction endonuclease subunit S [Pseudomonas sp. GD03856]MDH2266911.1 restriction endonuclease subunit S [Pseudomonas sp. GD03855]